MLQNKYDRITFSLPHDMNLALDNLKKIEEAVDMMAQEYENDAELTDMTILDTDDFL